MHKAPPILIQVALLLIQIAMLCNAIDRGATPLAALVTLFIIVQLYFIWDICIH